jgi:putative redox protein
MMISKSLDGNYSTEISNGVYKVFADSMGDSAESLHPHEFLEAGLAACMNITTRMVLDRMSLKYDGVEVKVSLERPDKENTVITYNIDIKSDIDEATKKLVTDKVFNCPVRKTLTSHIEVVKAQEDKKLNLL